MRSAHSVSLQIYVFPFTCFAFSSFFCHFVSPSPSPLPSFPLIAQPHRAVCHRGGKGEIGAPFRSPASPLPLSRRGPLAGFACILLTRMSTSGRRVGEGRFFFISPPLSSFPLILFCLAACAALACNCTGGVLALCKPPFGQGHCVIEMRGVIPLENPVFPPRFVASLRRDGELGRGGSFSFRPLCLLFPLFYICLAACATLACNCTGGVLALCVQCFVDASALRRSLERCRREQRVGVGATAENTGATARKRGRFLHRLPPFALESGARRVPSNRVVVVRGRAQTVPAANETNAEQKRNL